jgi:hypothetical protein
LSFPTNTRSVRINTELLRASILHTTLANVISLDQVFVADPKLYKYFYEGSRPSRGDPDYQKTVAVAQMFADILDEVTDSLGDVDDPAARAAWQAWITEMLATSPPLRDYLNLHRTWYSPALVQQLDSTKAPAAPEAPGTDAHRAPRSPAPAAGVRR